MLTEIDGRLLYILKAFKILVFMDICAYYQNATRNWQVSI